MTYEQLRLTGLGTQESTLKELPSLARDFRVNPIHLQERVSAIVTSVTCGERLQDVSENFARAGSSVRIRPVCSPDLVKGTSQEYLPTLPRLGIALGGEYGALAMSERLTSERGCSSSVGTPTCTATKRSAKFREGRTPNLQEFVEKFPTPLASSWGSKGCKNILQRRVDDGTITAEEKKKMVSDNGGKLNPTWVEWLMSFPLGWTELDASETPLFRNKRTRSSARSRTTNSGGERI